MIALPKDYDSVKGNTAWGDPVARVLCLRVSMKNIPWLAPSSQHSLQLVKFSSLSRDELLIKFAFIIGLSLPIQLRYSGLRSLALPFLPGKSQPPSEPSS